MTNRKNKTLINERTGIRNLTRKLVDGIQPSQSGISHDSLIKIDKEQAITYKVV